MAEIPVEMQTLQKPVIAEFRPDELLYRRFRPDHWEDGGVAAEAFKLPNMSVNRERLGPPIVFVILIIILLLIPETPLYLFTVNRCALVH